MDDGGKIVASLEVHIHPHDEPLLQELGVMLVGRGEDVLHEQLRLIDGTGEGDRA